MPACLLVIVKCQSLGRGDTLRDGTEPARCHHHQLRQRAAAPPTRPAVQDRVSSAQHGDQVRVEANQQCKFMRA